MEIPVITAEGDFYTTVEENGLTESLLFYSHSKSKTGRFRACIAITPAPIRFPCIFI